MARYRRTGRSKLLPLNVTSCGLRSAILQRRPISAASRFSRRREALRARPPPSGRLLRVPRAPQCTRWSGKCASGTCRRWPPGPRHPFCGRDRWRRRTLVGAARSLGPRRSHYRSWGGSVAQLIGIEKETVAPSRCCSKGPKSSRTIPPTAHVLLGTGDGQVPLLPVRQRGRRATELIGEFEQGAHDLQHTRETRKTQLAFEAEDFSRSRTIRIQALKHHNRAAPPESLEIPCTALVHRNN